MKKRTILTVFLITILVSVVFAAEYEVKIDFSLGESGWGPMGAAIYYVTNEDAKVGTLSLAVVGRNNVWEGTIFSLTDVLEEGGVYDVSLWIKAMDPIEEGTTAWITCVKENLEGEAEYSRFADPVEINTTEWVELKAEDFEFSLEGYNSVAIYVEVEDEIASYFLDDFTIKGDKPIYL